MVKTIVQEKAGTRNYPDNLPYSPLSAFEPGKPVEIPCDFDYIGTIDRVRERGEITYSTARLLQEMSFPWCDRHHQYTHGCTMCMECLQEHIQRVINLPVSLQEAR